MLEVPPNPRHSMTLSYLLPYGNHAQEMKILDTNGKIQKSKNRIPKEMCAVPKCPSRQLEYRETQVQFSGNSRHPWR